MSADMQYPEMPEGLADAYRTFRRDYDKYNSGNLSMPFSELRCSLDLLIGELEAADATCALRGAQKESGWRPIAEAPAGELLVVGWLDPEDAENPERHHFDWLEDGIWQSHEDAREHFLMCAPPGSKGPKEAAPYTHFMRLGRIPAPTPEGEAK
ncbi:MAG: hypothetical protein DI563_19375 [Variovorax paradoxus]|uniref:DUF551 domain-containing protein n=1 Tax=Variovorax paradoxus TaxID=34073 RepID=A0A2W5PVK2_VARPD|nr:MAG: hypothetical protein DI563_19375 [Variovorax paradoxus]